MEAEDVLVQLVMIVLQETLAQSLEEAHQLNNFLDNIRLLDFSRHLLIEMHQPWYFQALTILALVQQLWLLDFLQLQMLQSMHLFHLVHLQLHPLLHQVQTLPTFKATLEEAKEVK